MAMTLAKLRSGVQSAIRAGRSSDLSKRPFSSSAHHDVAYEAKEASKWEKITYLGIISCTTLAIYQLSKPHHHFPEPPAYPYMHIRNKEFPWGPDGLFEVKEHH
ncbi:cytochrome c oxidase subunit 6a, mitochondrial-like [Chenopodium quinoa]|uniref:cytochrome c oxidase subunit 6a, mitochondrial-like n=1 Tax=Chenopodium quinoa TaxID=63459 RepID=UPI000B794A43|nr:cytochrome c oxidase subunit 6a, mitochondrial-like [Chenopodium quinoa]